MTSTIAPPLPDFLTMPGTSPDLLRKELLDVIQTAIREHPRSQQVAIGPSEVGHPCARRIGYQLLEYDERPDQTPNWKATVGTAIHTWLEEQFGTNNAQHYEPEGTRWLLEETVDCGEVLGQPLVGHCDLYDQVTFTVVDWKSVGPTMLKKYKSKGVGPAYRAQAHLYGRGWARQGRRVDHVAVMFLPRQGELRDAYWWTEPYDEQIALDALQRVNGIALTTQALGNNALGVLPTADAFCQMCPFYKAGATDLTRGCPGDPSAIPSRSRDQITDLV